MPLRFVAFAALALCGCPRTIPPPPAEPAPPDDVVEPPFLDACDPRPSSLRVARLGENPGPDGTALAACEGGAPTATCANTPALCDLDVTSEIADPDFDHAVDIVFVPAGYTADARANFDDDVHAWMERLRCDATTIVGRAPQHFNVHTVHVPLAGGVDPLGPCVVGGDRTIVVADGSRVGLAASNAPAADITVVMFAGPYAADANGGGGRLYVWQYSPLRTFEHELGHAFAVLGDEYTAGGGACFTDTDPALAPAPFTIGPRGLLLNPNISTDAEGGPWRGIVDGAVEGAAYHERCVFRPQEHCMMNDYAPYCPVCSQAIDDEIRFFVSGDDVPPQCALELDQDPVAATSPLTIHARGVDAHGVEVTILIDDVEVATNADPNFVILATVLDAGDLRGTRLTARCTDEAGHVVERAVVLGP